jgi:hypothetical protein
VLEGAARTGVFYLNPAVVSSRLIGRSRSETSAATPCTARLLATRFEHPEELPITERFNLQFRSEFFNMLNKTNFRAPVINRSLTNFGQFTQAYQPRQIQFALKLQF